jgi:hypothetical protein
MSGEYIPTIRRPHLGEEALFKRQQDALNELANLAQRYDQRLTVNSCDIGQRYVEGGPNIGLKLRSRRNGDEFFAVVSRCDVRLKEHEGIGALYDEFWGLIEARRNQVSLGVHNHFGTMAVPEMDQASFENFEASHLEPRFEIDQADRNAVFLVPVQVVEGAQMCVPSRVCMGIADEVDCSVREQLFKFNKLGFISLHILPEREGNLVIFASEILRNLGQDVIKRLPQILKDVLGLEGEARGNVAASELIGFFRTLTIEAGAYGVSIGVKPFSDAGSELLDFGIGPFDLSTRPDKRFRFHDIESIMAKTDVTKDPAFQKVVQVFLNTPHQPHKPKMAKSPRKKRVSPASAKPKTAP